MTDLSEDQIANYKETFSLFDKDGDNKIAVSELGLLIRGLNQNPTEAEIEEMKNEVDPDGTGQLDFPEAKDIDQEEELMDAFRVFDKNQRGEVDATAIKHMIRTLGEPLSEEEANQFIQEANPNKETNSIRYADLVRILTTKYLM
ncbi:hypothetical protein pb186bvf_003686 [Paramecium bursaria]